LHFFLLDIVVIFIVPIILIVEIGTRGVVPEGFLTACSLVVVAVGMLEVDAATRNHSDFFRNGRDK